MLTLKPFVPYYLLFVNGVIDCVAICTDEQSAYAVAYAIGADQIMRHEECNHGMSAWLCGDPINHYVDHY